MKKIAAFVVFLALVGSTCLDLDLSLAPGLSVKNLLLYMLMIWIVFEGVLDSTGGGLLARRFEYQSLHSVFIVLILLAMFSAAMCVFVLQYEGYGILYAVMYLKASLVDHYLMFFVFLAALRNSGDAIWMLKAMLIAMTIAMILSLVEMFGLVQLGIMEPRSDGRLQGPDLGSNEYGALMSFYLPLTLVLAYRARGLWRVFWVVSAFVFLTVMIFSASRGAVVGLLGGTCIGLVLFSRYIKARYVLQSAIVVAVVAALAVAVLAIQHGDLLYTRFVEQTVTSNTFDQTSGRTEIWGDALALMSAAPVTFAVGFGWATFDLMNDWGSHNEYLEYLFDLGLVGLSLVLFIFVAVAYQLLSAARQVSADTRLILIGFAFGYFGILVSSALNHMSAPWLFIWGLIGTMLRLVHAERSEIEQRSSSDAARVSRAPSARHGKERAARAGL